MTSFHSRALASLDPIYRFTGSQVLTQRMDLDSPITVVHDVSRIAEMTGPPETPFHGFVNFSISNAHTVTGESVWGQQLTTQTQAFWQTQQLNPASSWLWLLEMSARFTAGLTVTEAMLLIDQATFTGAFTSHRRLVWRGIGGPTIPIDSGSTLAAVLPVLGAQFPRPILIPPNAAITFATAAAGAIATIIGQLQCWAGPRGVLPPGLA